MVHQLAYTSTAVSPWSRAQLLQLLVSARARNEAHAITGTLLHCDGRFLQLLEGSRADVDALYERIVADARHDEVTTVLRRRRLQRQFGSWTMTFRDLGTEPLDARGFVGLLDPSVAAVGRPTRSALARLRPTSGSGRALVNGSRVLGLVGAPSTSDSPTSSRRAPSLRP